MTPRPKRALLSVRSMLVMSAMLTLFVCVNTWDRWQDMTLPEQVPQRRTFVSKVSRHGIPWTYRTEIREWVTLEGSGRVLTRREMPPELRSAVVKEDYLLLDLAVALVVSVALTLASEQFIFSRMRRG